MDNVETDVQEEQQIEEPAEVVEPDEVAPVDPHTEQIFSQLEQLQKTFDAFIEQYAEEREEGVANYEKDTEREELFRTALMEQLETPEGETVVVLDQQSVEQLAAIMEQPEQVEDVTEMEVAAFYGDIAMIFLVLAPLPIYVAYRILKPIVSWVSNIF